MCLVVCHERLFRDPAAITDLEADIQRPVPDFACAGLPWRAGRGETARDGGDGSDGPRCDLSPIREVTTPARDTRRMAHNPAASGTRHDP
jgi:hypothetical protein